MLLFSMVYGITAEIPCSIAHLKAHSTDLGLQMHKTCMHTLALGIGHTLVNTTKGLNFSVHVKALLRVMYGKYNTRMGLSGKYSTRHS